MKVAQVAVYLDAEQARFIREDAQEAVLAADEDLEATMQISNLHARHLARHLARRSATFTSRSSASSKRQRRSSTAASTSCERATEHTP